MQCHTHQDHTTSNILAWTSHSANVDPSLEEEAAEVDEPPDPYATIRSTSARFQRAPLRRGSEQHESLLTKALQSHSEDDHSEANSILRNRRRSMASNTSTASTAEYTCDTGITTPARTSTPSPRIAAVGFGTLPYGYKTVAAPGKPVDAALQGNKENNPVVQELTKKRCISFACMAKPNPDSKTTMPPPPKPSTDAPKPTGQAPVKRPCIKFACPARPSSIRTTPPQHIEYAPGTKVSTSQKSSSPATVVDIRSPSAMRRVRSSTPRRSSRSPVAVRSVPSKKWLTANARDLQGESSRFHAFASDGFQEDDWIRREELSSKKKLTIDACLEKEYAIRKLGKEVEEEEEAELEEEMEDEADVEDEEDDDDVSGDEGDDVDEDEAEVDDEEQDGEQLDDGHSGYGSNEEGGSDGYNTDNEVGFADSEDEDDDLVLWTVVGVKELFLSGATPVRRRSSFAGEIMSDSSVYAGNKPRRGRRAAVRPPTPELPDSTDFVCGTLDEDRPLEEAYMTRLAARRQEKLHFIPQDIDPSFPTSEPEDEVEEMIEHGHDGSDDNLWLHGDMEDIHNEKGRKDRRHGRKKDNVSPKRYHSPPPKRHHSPPPKVRGRSPRQLFGGHSPRRLKSPPPPQVVSSPPASPVLAGQAMGFKPLASRPGLVFTKSLPRAAAMFGPMKTRRGRAGTITQGDHVRGAIDIVKGLEEKRQRRKEKFYQKYCTRARKNPAQGRRPAPGQGAQRMRDIGLTMAGKLAGPGNYVLSV